MASDIGAAFRALHEADGAFLIPNPWDAGSAVMVGAVRNALITANKRGKSNPLLTGFGRHVTLATEKYHMGDR